MKRANQYGLLLVAGSHTHQENYARAFAADGRCRLVGLTNEPNVSDRRRALDRRLASELDVPFLDDFDAALGRDDVDIVCVCADSERAGEVAATCARAGKHVYLDKPPASSVTAARELAAAAAESGVCSQMFSMVRSRALLESGRLGQLVGRHCELTFAKGPAGSADLSRPRRERATAERFTFIDSKRELFCVGVYPLVLFQWLTGAKFETVYASTSNYFFAEHQQNDVEDFACLLMQMTGGIDATITVGRTGWTSHPGHGAHQVHLIGTQGSETVDAWRPRLEVYSSAPRWSPPVRHPEDPMGFWASTQRESGMKEKTEWLPVATPLASDASHFLDCIDAGRPSDVPASVGAHAVEVILSAYRSAAEGTPVAV